LLFYPKKQNTKSSSAIVRHVVEGIQECEDGKYLLVKDPTKPSLRLYNVGWETNFDVDDGDEDEDEEEEELDM
jgi:hypothetical protein